MSPEFALANKQGGPARTPAPISVRPGAEPGYTSALADKPDGYLRRATLKSQTEPPSGQIARQLVAQEVFLLPSGGCSRC